MGLKEQLGKIWDGLERPGIQGSAELANALFNGTSYVPYGEGQRAADEPQQTQQSQQTGPALDSVMQEEPQHGLPQEAQRGREMEMER